MQTARGRPEVLGRKAKVRLQPRRALTPDTTAPVPARRRKLALPRMIADLACYSLLGHTKNY